MSDSVKIYSPHYCDFCTAQGVKRQATYDAKTGRGPWANMCDSHFVLHGIKLGTGFGQRLILIES